MTKRVSEGYIWAYGHHGRKSHYEAEVAGVMITVLNPQGIPPRIKRNAMAPRPETLAGKTVYLVDVRFNDGDVLLRQMENWLIEKMPEVKVKFVRKSGVYSFDDRTLWQEIKEEGDAVVMAVGH